MVSFSFKKRISHFILIALIIGFFAMPFAALAWNQPKTFSSKPAASFLILFFRS